MERNDGRGRERRGPLLRRPHGSRRDRGTTLRRAARRDRTLSSARHDARALGSAGGKRDHPVTIQEGSPPLHLGSPLLEVLLVVHSITVLVGVLEFVEGGVFRIEQFAVTPEESFVDHTRFAHRSPFSNGSLA